MDRASMRAFYFWLLICLPCASSAAAIVGKAGGSVALTGRGPEKINTGGITGHLQPVMKVNVGNSKSKINLKRSLVRSCWGGAHGIPETQHVSNPNDLYHENGSGWRESTKNMFIRKPIKSSRENDRKRKEETHSETSTEETNGSSQEDQDFTFPTPKENPNSSNSAIEWIKSNGSPARSDSVASSYSVPANSYGLPSPYYYQNGAHYPKYHDRQSGNW